MWKFSRDFVDNIFCEKLHSLKNLCIIIIFYNFKGIDVRGASLTLPGANSAIITNPISLRLKDSRNK